MSLDHSGSLHSTERFSARVENYVKYRPSYPDAVIGFLRDAVGLKPQHRIADIGSGTGISTELFLKNGNTVYAVEPNRDMREAAERLLKAYPDFHSVAGTAEATTLPASTMDVAVAAQAFHWFDRPKAAAEFRRILKPDGVAVLIWNVRRTDATPFLIEYEKLLLTFGTDYQAVRHENIDAAALHEFFGALYSSQTFPFAQSLDYTGLRGRLESSSYVPASGQPQYAEMIAALERLFNTHQENSAVRVEYDTVVYHGKVSSVRASNR